MGKLQVKEVERGSGIDRSLRYIEPYKWYRELTTTLVLGQPATTACVGHSIRCGCGDPICVCPTQTGPDIHSLRTMVAVRGTPAPPESLGLFPGCKHRRIRETTPCCRAPGPGATEQRGPLS